MGVGDAAMLQTILMDVWHNSDLTDGEAKFVDSLTDKLDGALTDGE